VRASGCLEQRLELALRLLRDVLERSKRARSEQRVAATPQDGSRLAARITEVPQQRGLSHPGLAADELKPATRAPDHRGECLV
jgi:hypothetical protein